MNSIYLESSLYIHIYYTNICKNQYTRNEQIKNEIKKNNSIYYVIKMRNKTFKTKTEHILGKYKTLLKEIKEDLNKLRDILSFWIRNLNIDKMAILPKLFYRFNVFHLKPQQDSF